MLCLIRHGETSANRDRLYAGTDEYPLTQRGIEQAYRIGGIVASGAFGELQKGVAIHSSPIGRALQTAKIISEVVGGSPVTVDERIKEVDYGALEGQPITKGLSFVNESRKAGGGGFAVEPLPMVRERAQGFLSDMSDAIDPNNPALTIAVGHGTFWSILRAGILEADPWEIKIQKNDEILLVSGVEAKMIHVPEYQEGLIA